MKGYFVWQVCILVFCVRKTTDDISPQLCAHHLPTHHLSNYEIQLPAQLHLGFSWAKFVVCSVFAAEALITWVWLVTKKRLKNLYGLGEFRDSLDPKFSWPWLSTAGSLSLNSVFCLFVLLDRVSRSCARQSWNHRAGLCTLSMHTWPQTSLNYIWN